MKRPRYCVPSEASQVKRFRFGAPYLGRSIWDALSETPYLGRLCYSGIVPSMYMIFVIGPGSPNAPNHFPKIRSISPLS